MAGWGSAAALSVVAISGGCGSDAEPRPVATPAIVTSTVPATVPAKVAARWERIATFAGTGNQRTGSFSIADHAIQWRVTATCADGHVRVGLETESAPLTDAVCPGREFGFSIREGPAVLDVVATGGWEVLVDQQVETPASEPALAGMSDAALVADGTFYGIDQEATGTAALYRLPDGRRALRFEPFFVTPNTDLFVWVSETEAPRTSEQALNSAHVQIHELTATAGSQNYVLPESVDSRRIRSVVIWCEPVRTAYAAAALVRS